MIKQSLSDNYQIYYEVLQVSGINVHIKETPKTFKWKVLKTLHPFCLFIIVIPYDILHLLYLFTPDDFESVILNLGLVVNTFALCVRLVVLIYKKNTLKYMFFKAETFNSNQHRPEYALFRLKKIYNFSTYLSKRWKFYFMFLCFLWYVLPMFWSEPFINFMSGQNSSYAEFAAILPTTYPFRCESPVAEIRYVFEIINGFIVSIFWPTLNTIFVVIVLMINVQYEILYDSLEKKTETMGNDKKQPMELKMVIEDHVKLLRAAKEFKDLLSPLIALQLLNSSLVIGGVMNFANKPTEDNVSLAYMIAQIFCYMILALAELLIYCLMSYIVNQANENLLIALYGNQWYLDVKKKDLDLILPLMMSQKDLNFTALGMVKINLKTFLDVLRISYSGFTLMRQMDENP